MERGRRTRLDEILAEEGRKQTWLVEQLLARGIRASRGQVSNWVRGLHVPIEDTRDAVADILCRNVDDVFPPATYAGTRAA